MASGQSTKDRVLDAAEKNFAADGFAGAGMKAIAADAEVAQGLLHYHFDTKAGLYRDVIARRSASINEARLALLEKVDTTAPDALEQVFRAFLTPPFNSGIIASGYPQMLARLVVGGAMDQELIEKHYDACALRFIDVLQAILPDATRQDLAHCYTNAIGAMITAFSRADRAMRLAATSGEKPETTTQTIAGLARFCAAGARAFNTSKKKSETENQILREKTKP